MKQRQSTRHFQVITHRRPAAADLSWFDTLLGVLMPNEKSVRVQK